MANHKILVTGANGQLGQSLKAVSHDYPQFEFHFAGRDNISIDDARAVDAAFAAFKPDYVINAAAYTAVDKAESDKDGALAINGKAVGILAEASKKVNAGFIHVSTDYVFDGLSETPYTEDHPTDPVNNYGASKLEGEKLALEKNDGSIIIRTAWVYSEFGNNFVKTMLRLMKDRKEIGVVYDQVGAPTFASDLARGILDIIAKTAANKLTWVAGLYHYSNQGRISWYDFAESIKSKTNQTCKVNAITTPEFPTPAKRPAFSLLDTSKIRSTYQLDIPGWEESLDVCLIKLGVV
ncbi:MAG: dTDP-4-dehydrorhamnose reductase [Chitinophagaceae bacterium]|nr:MAG: dTDP-4-dehydrorhamnose reductase [Chitinophagaceae bacterium]